MFICIYIFSFLPKIFMMSVQSRMAPSTRRAGVLRIPGEASAADVRVDTSVQSIGSTPDTISSDGPSSFTVNFCNIRGLRSNLPSVEHHLSSHLPNLLLLSETQVSCDVSPDSFNISHYNLYSKFRSKGGICAYCNINTPIARYMVLESPNFDALWLKICLPTTTIFLCFCYCSPNNFDYSSFFEYLTSCHESLQLSNPHAEVLYIGDFNVHHTEWLNSSTTDSGGREAYSFSILHELEQIIKHPTRVPDRHDQTPNTLDLFFTSNPSLYSYTISSPLGSSDHCLISISSSWAQLPPLPPSQRLLWHFERAQRADLSSFLLDFPWREYCFFSGDSSLAALKVVEVLLSGMEAYIPSSIKTFSPTNPWFDHSCSRAIQAREEAYRSYKESPSEINHSNFISARNRCKTVIRRAKHSYLRRRCSNLTDSPTNSALFSLAKGLSNNFSNSCFPPLFRPDGSIASSALEKAALFGSIFSTNSTLDDSDATTPPTQPLINPIPLPFFSYQKVREALLSLDTSKAQGPDGIPARFLKEFHEELAPVFHSLFRLIVSTHTYPSPWKHSLCQPASKKGDHSDPSNYRPIALTSIIAKVFESLLNAHLLKHLESHSLLSDHQYGFRKARSTGDLLSYLTHKWSSSLRDFGESYVVALDISKAFDRVWHKALLAKLPSYGFSPPLCNLISSFLSNRSISVVVDGATSDPFSISSGVPQGSVLSPILFLLFINDLLQTTANPVHSYADDSTLHKSSSFSTQPSALIRSQSRIELSSSINSDLGRISDWGQNNLVRFNASKTQFLPISLSSTPSDFVINFEDKEIEPLPSINILGVNVTNNLSWRHHIIGLARSASRKLGILYRCRAYFSSPQLLQIYKGLIRPCMEYCSHIWGGSTSTYILDRVESKAIRLINEPTLTSSLDSLSLRRKVASLSLFYRYYFGRCSAELSDCVPPPLRRPRSTRQALASHKYCVELGNPRLGCYSGSFFPSTSRLWNSLPESIFPSHYNLSQFKRRVCQHLRGGHSGTS